MNPPKNPPKETRDDRVRRLKNKFRTLGGLGLVKEYIRYERAKDGTLPHQFQAQYIEEIMAAMEQLIREHYKDDGRHIVRTLGMVRKYPSKPFLPPK